MARLRRFVMPGLLLCTLVGVVRADEFSPTDTERNRDLTWWSAGLEFAAGWAGAFGNCYLQDVSPPDLLATRNPWLAPFSALGRLVLKVGTSTSFGAAAGSEAVGLICRVDGNIWYGYLFGQAFAGLGVIVIDQLDRRGVQLGTPARRAVTATIVAAASTVGYNIGIQSLGPVRISTEGGAVTSAEQTPEGWYEPLSLKLAAIEFGAGLGAGYGASLLVAANLGSHAAGTTREDTLHCRNVNDLSDVLLTMSLGQTLGCEVAGLACRRPGVFWYAWLGGAIGSLVGTVAGRVIQPRGESMNAVVRLLPASLGAASAVIGYNNCRDPIVNWWEYALGRRVLPPALVCVPETRTGIAFDLRLTTLRF